MNKCKAVSFNDTREATGNSLLSAERSIDVAHYMVYSYMHTDETIHASFF